MNSDKLFEGQVFKNYKAMCEELGLSWTEGNAKVRQIKNLERYCFMRKEGHKIMVEKVFKIPLPELDGRGAKPISTPLIDSNPVLASEWHSYLNGTKLRNDTTRTTQGNFWWTCSKCENIIYSSMRKRLRTVNGDTSDDNIICMYCVLSAGAKKVADFLMEYGLKYTTEITFEELVSQDGNKLRFDFAILSNKDEIIALVEYDGEFHYYAIGNKDINKSIENLKKVQLHDNLKNKYCEENSIPLVRVPFFKDNEIEELAYEFVNAISEGVNYVSPTAPNVDPVESILNNRIKEINKQLEKYNGKMDDLRREKDDIAYELKMNSSIERYNITRNKIL